MTPPRTSRGTPRPLGAAVTRDGVNFALFSKNATAVTLVLFLHGRQIEFPLDPRVNRTGHVWHVLVHGLGEGCEYAYRLAQDPAGDARLHRFDARHLLLDPYARALTGAEEWGYVEAKSHRQRTCLVPSTDFDWDHDQPLNIPLADSIIYELHVRGFTRHASSGVAHPGTFLGLTEKIPYLRSLGVTAVELLPVYEFEESDTDRFNPFTGEMLVNFWGYQPIGFFAPNSSFAFQAKQGGAVREFKQMVKAFHKAGIEVILDVVFNHTCEGDERGPTRSFRGIDNSIYYMVDPTTGAYLNYSGCGNTVNCNNPVVRAMISDALEYWVQEMHVDGFRFDLASILGRGQDGSVLTNPPLLEEIANNPVLANTKLIAEAWDAAGLYQVGTFPSWGRWAEWNGKYRDDVRSFLRGDYGKVSAFATRVLGSPDLYLTSAREPYHSINFVTCHDGFTLRDLVSYNEKHNLANGENNLDGTGENLSWNCGAEGPSDDPNIAELRLRQQKNFAAVLLLSHGVPMILGGDEMGRTQLGNNNAYCQDNEISWVDWGLAERNAGLVRFFRHLIAFRKSSPLLRRRSYAGQNGEPDLKVTWHGTRRMNADWGYNARSLAMQLTEGNTHLHLIVNAWRDALVFELPRLPKGKRWRRLLDTCLPSPEDIAEPPRGFRLSSQESYDVGGYSVAAFIA